MEESVRKRATVTSVVSAVLGSKPRLSPQHTLKIRCGFQIDTPSLDAARHAVSDRGQRVREPTMSLNKVLEVFSRRHTGPSRSIQNKHLPCVRETRHVCILAGRKQKSGTGANPVRGAASENGDRGKAYRGKGGGRACILCNSPLSACEERGKAKECAADSSQFPTMS